MITVHITLADGALVTLDSRGHASKRGSASIPCAAVSTLLRSFAAAVGDSKNVSGEARAPAEGVFSLRILSVYDSRWFLGASDTLLTGLRQVAADFPREVEMHVQPRASETEAKPRECSD
ncbi:MAG: ribosomal-processing cysteine protease Prp [Spirochaetales bacterium]